MKLQKQILYAIDMVGLITQRQANDFTVIVKTTELANVLTISDEFTRNLLAKLSKAEILTSVKGPKGGYRLASDPAKITLGSIIKAICPDESDSLNENMLTSKTNLSNSVCQKIDEGFKEICDLSVADFVNPKTAGVSE